MRKYINIAKCMKPKLTQPACELFSSEYSLLKSQELEDTHIASTQPATARTLETLIRLGTAHAKARMVKTIKASDAEASIELVQFAYFKRVLEKEKKKRRCDSDSFEEDEMEKDGAGEAPSQEGTRKSKRTRIQPMMEVDSEDEEVTVAPPQDTNDLTMRSSIRDPRPSTSAGDQSASTVTISDDRF